LRMIPKKEIYENRVLSLAWKSKMKGKSCKRGYIFQNGLFLVGVTRNTQLLKSISKSKRLQVRINGNIQLCAVRVVDDFEYTKAFLKKEIERLVGRKLGPKSRFAQKLDGIAARHVVVELKPVKR